jgi:hypothetical protein
VTPIDGDRAGSPTDQIEPAAPAGPPARRPRTPSDNRTLRRVVFGAVVVVALGCFVVAGFVADTDSDDQVAVSGDVVERLIPAADFAVLQQNPVGVDLAAGWGVEAITVNGTSVPENEWDVTPELGLYQVIPTDGTTIERLLPQENCVEVVAFELLDPTATESIQWCFTAT